MMPTMENPEGIPQWAWEKAGEAFYGRHVRGFIRWPLMGDADERVSLIARALMEADKAAREGQREKDASWHDKQAQVISGKLKGIKADGFWPDHSLLSMEKLHKTSATAIREQEGL